MILRSKAVIRARLKQVKKTLEWPNTIGCATLYWQELEDENKRRMADVLRLAEELADREVTIAEFAANVPRRDQDPPDDEEASTCRDQRNDEHVV